MVGGQPDIRITANTVYDQPRSPIRLTALRAGEKNIDKPQLHHRGYVLSEQEIPLMTLLDLHHDDLYWLDTIYVSDPIIIESRWQETKEIIFEFQTSELNDLMSYW